MTIPIAAKEVGPVYDLLLATRDGQPLPCRNNDGQIVQVSQVAYMTTIDPSIQQHEETELQHKDLLIQLGTGSTIDRELEQWPQNTQGDWSGGILQRVFTGPNADPSRYWDGQGLVWPTSDIVPQQPFMPPEYQDQAGAMSLLDRGAIIPSTVAPGNLGFFGTPGEGYAFFYMDAAGHSHLTYLGGFPSGGVRLTVTDPPGTSQFSIPASSGIANTLGDLIVGNSVIWWASSPVTPDLRIFYAYPSGGALATATFATIPFNGAGLTQGCLALGLVGRHMYIAVAYFFNSNFAGFTNSYSIRIFQVSDGVNGTPGTFIDLPMPSGLFIEQLLFYGDNLIISATDGTMGYLLQYNIATQTFSMLARIPESTGLRCVEVGGSLFVLSVNQASGNQMSVDMYLVQPGSVQSIGPLNQGAYVTGCSRPSAYGPYACFAVIDINNQMQVYAYDTLRGRLFHVQQLGGLSPNFGPALDNYSIATVAMMNRSSPANLASQWGIVVPVLGPTNNFNVQEMLFSVQPQGQTTSVRGGLDVISSIIDFTSAQPKLYRQVLAKFSALGVNAAASVTLSAWLDKDPSDINLSNPDFSVTIAGSVTNQNVTRLALIVNQIATKLVYRVQVTGGVFVGAGFVAAPKLQSVIVRVASGWVQTLTLDLAPQLGSNSKSVQDIWTYQGIDSVAAYNFLRMLWRLRGGECNATFPNGDSGPWLLQDGHFDSPKPFGVSFRADQRSGLKFIASVKIREDIN